MATRKPKRYPLTAAQRMHELTLMHCPKKQILNIGTSVTIQVDVDFDALREAVREAYARCDAMRLRFCRGVGRNSGKMYQYIEPAETREIEYFNFAHWKQEDADALMRSWTEVPFEELGAPMNRLVMISMPGGYNGLYLNVDHRTMDSHGVIVFLSDIIELYAHKKHDYPAPRPLGSYEQVLIEDLAYEAGSKQLERDRAYWHGILDQPEPVFAGVTGPGELERQRAELSDPAHRAVRVTSPSVEACISVYHLEPQPTRELLDFCARENAPVVCLLLMGLRTYLSKMNGGEPDVGVKSTVARRGTLAQKRSGGTRIHYFPCRTVVTPDKTFREGLQIVREAQNGMFRHANYDPILFTRERMERFHLTPGENYEPLSLTYQPMSMRKQDLEKLGGIAYRANWYSNGVAASPLYLTVMHNPEDDGLDFYFEHQKGAVSEETLEKLYYYLCRIMFQGIQQPERTVGEIIASV